MLSRVSHFPVSHTCCVAVLLFGYSTSNAGDQGLNASERPDLATVLTWLPVDTETIAASRSFKLAAPLDPTLVALAKKKKDASEAEQLRLGMAVADSMIQNLPAGPVMLNVGMVFPTTKEPFSGLESQKVALAVFGGRNFVPDNPFGFFCYEGAHLIVLEKPLARDGAALLESMRKNAKEVRDLDGKEVFEFHREPISVLEQRIRGIGMFATLLRANVICSATSYEYLRDLLVRYRTPDKRRALPADLPEWKYVDTSARWWLVRHIDKPSNRLMGRKDIRVGVGAAMTFAPGERNEVQVVYIPTSAKAENYMRQRWLRDYTGGKVDADDKHVSLIVPLEPPSQSKKDHIDLLSLWRAIGEDYILRVPVPGDPSN